MAKLNIAQEKGIEDRLQRMSEYSHKRKPAARARALVRAVRVSECVRACVRCQCGARLLYVRGAASGVPHYHYGIICSTNITIL